jgi:hypothetical protein
MGIQLTPPATTCSIRVYEGGLSTKLVGVRIAICHRQGVSRVFGPDALAGGLRLFSMWKPNGLADAPSAAGLWSLSLSGLCDGGNDFSGHPQATKAVVPSDMVCDQSEEWK